MLLRLYLYTLFFLTLIFWATFIIFIFYINPSKADNLTFGVFYASLFLALLGTAALTGFFLRLKIFKKSTVSEHLLPSLRQGVLIALFVLGILVFFALNIFTWWTASLYFAVLFLLELILRTR